MAAVPIVEIALAIWLPLREKNNEESIPVSSAKGFRDSFSLSDKIRALKYEHHVIHDKN